MIQYAHSASISRKPYRYYTCGDLYLHVRVYIASGPADFFGCFDVGQSLAGASIFRRVPETSVVKFLSVAVRPSMDECEATRTLAL